MKVKKLHYLFIVIWLAIIAFVYTKVSAIGLIFKNIENESFARNFSSVHFMWPWNDFVWWILWLTSKSLPSTIDISLWNKKIACNKQVRGMYVNSQRGKRVRPLDVETLQLLKSMNQSYTNLSLSWWLYTSCSGHDYSIFGQITYNQSGTISYLIAGSHLIYTGNKYTIPFRDNLQYFNNTTPVGYLRDSQWWIWFVGWKMSWHQELIEFLNSGWNTINDAFSQTSSGTISTITGSLRTFDSITRNTAVDIIRNLLIYGNVWLSQSLLNQDRSALLGNPQEKTVIIGTDNINNSTIINQAKKNMEKLCKWKEWLKTDNLPEPPPDILCFEKTNLEIDLEKTSLYGNKTIIMRNGNIILENSMKHDSPPLDIFIDGWSLFINPPSSINKLEGFSSGWYVPAEGQTANQWVLLKWNIIINGLMMGEYNNGTISKFPHKLYIYGKISTLNTPFAPTTTRESFVQQVVNTWAYKDWINLQNIFGWTCSLGGTWSDGTSCSSNNRISSVPLVIIDAKYPSKLLK